MKAIVMATCFFNIAASSKADIRLIQDYPGVASTAKGPLIWLRLFLDLPQPTCSVIEHWS
jgi:hypothetical protein